LEYSVGAESSNVAIKSKSFPSRAFVLALDPNKSNNIVPAIEAILAEKNQGSG
jgi:hypothetical protein